MTIENAKPSFSINLYDRDGDAFEDGIYLHYENTIIKVSNGVEGFKRYIEHLQSMVSEISENC